MRAVEQGIERGGAGDLPRQGRGQCPDPTRVSALGVIHPMRQKSTNARCVWARAALDAGGLGAFEERRDAVEEDSQGGPAGGGTADLGGRARRGDGLARAWRGMEEQGPMEVEDDFERRRLGTPATARRGSPWRPPCKEKYRAAPARREAEAVEAEAGSHWISLPQVLLSLLVREGEG